MFLLCLQYYEVPKSYYVPLLKWSFMDWDSSCKSIDLSKWKLEPCELSFGDVLFGILTFYIFILINLF